MDGVALSSYLNGRTLGGEMRGGVLIFEVVVVVDVAVVGGGGC